MRVKRKEKILHTCICISHARTHKNRACLRACVCVCQHYGCRQYSRHLSW